MKRMILESMGLLFAALPLTSPAVVIDWVAVGDVGNANDSTGYGGVSTPYKIGKYEVTNDQYVEFLNAVDPTGANALSLWNSNMATSPRGGIDYNGAVWFAKSNMGNKPVNYVSFFDAMRFVNWLENGQGSSGTETGVYTIGTGINETRNPSASYWIPSEDEWYKAAYYDPLDLDGDGGSYELYPTSFSVPFAGTPTEAAANSVGDISNPGAHAANYNNGADWNGQDGNVTTVGSGGALSASYYGTFDQGGNVDEWNEAVASGVNRGLRGGAWSSSESNLRATLSNNTGPANELDFVGFRVAGVFEAVPEPSSTFLAAIAAGAVALRRRVRRN